MMNKHLLLKQKKGISLIEIMVALCVSSILMAGSYRVFIGQQKTYQVQDQVADMQQNARLALQKMLTEIRMAGFGNVTGLLPLSAIGGPFQNIINPVNNKNNVNQNDDQVTIVGAFDQVSTLAVEPGKSNTIVINRFFNGVDKAASFNPAGNNKYICVGGVEPRIVTGVNVSDQTVTLTLPPEAPLTLTYQVGTPVFKVKAITYRLAWDGAVPTMPVLTREDNTDGGGPQVVADNIQNLQFRYTLKDGSESDSPGTPADIRVIRVDVLAKTNMNDPDYKVGGGYRTRQIVSNIQPRNIALTP